MSRWRTPRGRLRLRSPFSHSLRGTLLHNLPSSPRRRASNYLARPCARDDHITSGILLSTGQVNLLVEVPLRRAIAGIP